MGREVTKEERASLTKEERASLMLATVAIEDDEKESKKPQRPRILIYRPYAPKGFLPSWPIKKKILAEIGLWRTEQVPKISENKKRKHGNNAKTTNQVSAVLDGPNPPPRMPEKFKNIIFKETGIYISDEKLVVQKKLEHSDCNEGQNRLSILKPNLEKHFLADVINCEKRQTLNIIDPSLKRYQIDLCNWKPFYALNRESWRKIKETNNLQPGMIVQLWGFRVKNELWFALVDLPSPVENNRGTKAVPLVDQRSF